MIKKFKRLCAGLLSCILILSSMTVYAAEEATADTMEEYTLTVKTENGNATVTGDGVTQTGENTYTVLSGSSVTAKTDPAEGYETEAIKLNGVDVSYSDNTASFEMPSQDSSLDIMFSEIPEPENQETVETEEESGEQASNPEKEESLLIETGENPDADTNESVSDEEEKDEIVGESSTGTNVESIDSGQTDDEAVEEKEESATTESVAEEEDEEQYDITFRVHGNGNVKLEYQDQEPVTVGGDESTTLSLDVDTYIRVTAESEEETNISMAVTNGAGIELEPTITERSTSYTREITVTEIDKVVDISFSDTLVNTLLAPRLLAASARGTEQQPEVGDRFTGDLTVVSVDGGDGHTVHGVTIRATSGILQGEGSFTVDCAQHSAAAPTSGMGYSYTYTITSVDESTGRVTGSLYAISHTQPSDGVTTDGNGNLIGYQALSGTLSITREYNGSLNLLKTSANTEITSGNSNYSLSGAVYGVYTDRSCTDRVATLTTTASGSSNTADITAGQYYVKEITAPRGYALDTTVYSVTVTAGQTATVNVSDVPQSDPVSILLGKVDAETTANMPQGSASLEGAEFTINYYSGFYSSVPSVQPTRSWVMRTDERGFTRLGESYKVSGDDFYYMSTGDITLPLGTITIQETKAPDGYLLNDEIYIRQITSAGTAERVNTYNEPTIPEDIIRGDLELVKFGEPEDAEEDQMIPLEGIVFEITSKTTGETVEITTDSHGFASTEQLGISDRGNLVYDTYVVHEKNTPAGYEPVDDFEVTISEEGQTLYYILEDKQILSPVQLVKVDSTTGQTIPIADTEFQLLDADKNPISMTTYYPSEEVHETFKTDETGSFTLPEKLPAGVYYFRELNAPAGYLLNGEDLQFEITEGYDWDEPLVVTFADAPAMGQIQITKTDSDAGYPLAGTEFTVTAAEDIVTPDGTVRATAGEAVDTITTGYDGIGQSKELFLGKYTVTESKQPSGYVLSDQSWDVELTYQDQLTEIVTESLEVQNSPTKVTIEKIQAGTDKHLAGVQFVVWNKAMADDEIDPGFAVKETYTTDENGMISLERLQPGTYCVQETATIAGYILNDAVYEFTVSDDGRINGQDSYTLTVENEKERNPQLHTTAIDLESGTHEAIAKEDITIRDYVDYTDVEPGTYTMVGILMDQSTGEPLLVNGEQVTTEKEVQISDENGTLTMDFTFDASELNGTSTVVFEYLYPGERDNHDDTPYASHEDINDKDQTVSFKVGTLTPYLPNQSGSGVGMTAPQTGDNTTLYYVLGMMCIASGVGIVTYVIRKRKKVNEDEK